MNCGTKIPAGNWYYGTSKVNYCMNCAVKLPSYQKDYGEEEGKKR